MSNRSPAIKARELIRTLENEEGLKFLHATPTGDDFASAFWWKRTMGHSITTAVIITVLGGILVYTERIKSLKSPENQVYQIQVIPYEPK